MAKTCLHENARLEAKRRLNEHHWIPNMNEHLIHNEHEEQNDVIIYRSKDGKIIVSLMNCDGNVWLNQAQIATLFTTSKQNVGQHISNILKENELDANSVVKNYFTTASDGKQYNVTYYSLPMIIAIGFRVRGIRGTQFRQWANLHLAEYMIKGFTMDDERLKNPDGRPDYFDELLARVRDIRVSEKRFYQKLRDLFKLSSDYEAREKATQMFYAETQNKLLYAVTGRTAAEIIVDRADEKSPNMGLTVWKGNIVRKGDNSKLWTIAQSQNQNTIVRIGKAFCTTSSVRTYSSGSILFRAGRVTR